ncbi:MAG: hypothetical protein QOI62_1485 [Solirubrobacteraceae bacterium]|nr:hypothetical protein [Solirubrobacteraceae bacterium]
MVSLLGDGIVPVALAFAVLDLTGSASDLGIVLAARMVAMAACLLVGGVIADRTSRRRVMIASDLVRLVCQALLGLLLVAGHARLWELVAFQAVLGGASGFFNPASSGLIPMVVSPAGRQDATLCAAWRWPQAGSPDLPSPGSWSSPRRGPRQRRVRS